MGNFQKQIPVVLQNKKNIQARVSSLPRTAFQLGKISALFISGGGGGREFFTLALTKLTPTPLPTPLRPSRVKLFARNVRQIKPKR